MDAAALTHEVRYAEAGTDRVPVPGLRAPLDGAAILANARSVGPVLREEADEGERRRRLTPRAVDTLRSAGAFRMARPRAWGGPEVDPLTQVEVFETLAQATGRPVGAP
jgi:alkylation response protein AidB-like acyl-CoA dehydrogenase